ncbi:MAG TPA: MBL fold metallo-hydrolase [Gemmatimonadaceae bacterium]|nr:MBL fold metallo-hydrolase [Gemmatimonadaceae bacterium]
MEITFVGAAREVTGSCHLLHVNGYTVALDCGMFQGRRQDAAEKNRKLPLPIEKLDAVVLSHAHIDHSGRLPYLIAEGYSKTIWATSATRDLSAVMLADSAHIQEKDAEFLAKKRKDFVEPLYGMRHAVRTMDLMNGMPYNRVFDVVPGIRATYIDAGHILGSASVALDCTENGKTKRLVFSGDIGRSGLAIVRDPTPPQGADALIMESTYGNRDHESVDGARAKLAEIVRETAARGGRVLIPAFAVGRTQEMIYALHGLVREGAIPSIPIYVDSPLAIDTTTVFEMHPETFDRSEEMVQKAKELFRFELLHYTRDVEESKALSRAHGPMIIIAASGMMENGRILHHLAQGASDPRNTILVVGFQAEHTLGRRVVERQPVLQIFGEDVPLYARVEVIDGYSAHADRTEMITWLTRVKEKSPRLGPIWLVHGEAVVQDEFKATLAAHGYNAECPEPHTTHSF